MPPQAVELEEAVLGALMLEKDSIITVQEFITPEAFYTEEHRTIYRAIEELSTELKPIDLYTVTERLKAKKELKKVGGASYLAQLTQKVGSAANVEFHAKIIAQKYVQRELIRSATEIQRRSYDESTDVTDLIGYAEGEIFKVAEGHVKRSVQSAHDILARALQQAKEGRAFILQKMLDVIPEPRHTTRSTAPRIVSIQVPTDKIRDVIGSGGKVIRGIQDETGASVDIQEDGTVFVGGTGESVDQAVERIKLIIKVPEPGEEYTGRVVSIQPFGAFVNLLPGKDGLLHISRVAKGRVEKVEDVLNVGDEVKVVVIEVDDRGKISLDRLDKPEAPARAEGASEGDGEHFQRRERPRRERSERSDRPRRPGDNGGRKPRRHHDAE